MIQKVIEMDIPSLPNMRAHWGKVARIKSNQRNLVFWSLSSHTEKQKIPDPPCTVRLVRIGPRPLDGDNNVASLKAIRDEVAKILGVDDADPSVTWEYGQKKGEPKQVAVEITIKEAGDEDGSADV